MVKHIPLFSIDPVKRRQMAEKNIHLLSSSEDYFIDNSLFFRTILPRNFLIYGCSQCIIYGLCHDTGFTRAWTSQQDQWNVGTFTVYVVTHLHRSNNNCILRVPRKICLYGPVFNCDPRSYCETKNYVALYWIDKLPIVVVPGILEPNIQLTHEIVSLPKSACKWFEFPLPDWGYFPVLKRIQILLS